VRCPTRCPHVGGEPECPLAREHGQHPVTADAAKRALLGGGGRRHVRRARHTDGDDLASRVDCDVGELLAITAAEAPSEDELREVLRDLQDEAIATAAPPWRRRRRLWKYRGVAGNDGRPSVHRNGKRGEVAVEIRRPAARPVRLDARDERRQVAVVRPVVGEIAHREVCRLGVAGHPGQTSGIDIDVPDEVVRRAAEIGGVDERAATGRQLEHEAVMKAGLRRLCNARRCRKGAGVGKTGDVRGAARIDGDRVARLVTVAPHIGGVDQGRAVNRDFGDEHIAVRLVAGERSRGGREVRGVRGAGDIGVAGQIDRDAIWLVPAAATQEGREDQHRVDHERPGAVEPARRERDGGAVEAVAGGDVLPGAVDLLICDRRREDDVAIPHSQDQLASRRHAGIAGAFNRETRGAGIRAGSDHHVVLQLLAVAVEHDVDAVPDVGIPYAAERRDAAAPPIRVVANEIVDLRGSGVFACGRGCVPAFHPQ
jgi:hypothetical protein